MSNLGLGGMLALVFVLSVGALVLVVIPACVVSGRISERERQSEDRQAAATMETADDE